MTRRNVLIAGLAATVYFAVLGGITGAKVGSGLGPIALGSVASVLVAVLVIAVPHWLAGRGPAPGVFGRLRGERPRAGLIVIGIAVWFAGFWTMQSITSIFPLLRAVGEPAATLSSLASNPEATIATWKSHPSAGGDDTFASALGVIAWATAVELFFVLLGAALALVLTLRAVERCKTGPSRRNLNLALQAATTAYLFVRVSAAIVRLGVANGRWDDRPPPSVYEFLGSARVTTAASLALLAPVLVIGSIIAVEGIRAERPELLRRVHRLRIIIAAVVFQAALLLVVPLQIPDYLLHLIDGSLFLTPIFVVVFAAGVGVIFVDEAEAMLKPRPAPQPLHSGRFTAFALAICAVGALLWSIGWGWGLLIPGLALLGTGVISLLLERRQVATVLPKTETVGRRPVDEADDVDPTAPADSAVEPIRTPLLTPVLVALPPFLLAVALTRWSFAESIYVRADTGADAARWIVFFLALVAVVLAITFRKPRRSEIVRSQRLALPGAVFVSLFILPFSIQSWGDFLGSVGIVEVVTGGAVVALGSLVRFADRWRPPTLLVSVGFERQPVLFGLVVWAVVSSVIGGPGTYDVRPTIALAPTPDVITCDTDLDGGVATAEGLLDRWLVRNGMPNELSSDDAAPAPDDDQRTAVPLAIVAASGGGIRAAWWTARVMTETFGGTPRTGSCASSEPIALDRVLFASGISGGSLGLAEYNTALLAGDATDDSWVFERLGDDFVTPTVGWLLVVETLHALLRFPLGQDRAEVLEKTWELSWSDLVDRGDGILEQEKGPHELEVGLRATTRDHPELPVLVLSGATVGEGCVLMATVALSAVGDRYARESDCHQPPVDGALPGVLPLSSLLCDDEDLRLSTASLLSARFPLISPSGRIDGCNGFSMQVVDGGYIDASAAGQALTMWDAIEPLVERYNASSTTHCIEPFFVQIDNGFELAAPVPTDRGGIGEFIVPVKAVLSAYGRESKASRAEAAARFGDHFVRIAPQARPGLSPALGWTLSRSSQDIMEEAVTSGVGVASTIEILDEALTSTGTACS